MEWSDGYNDNLFRGSIPSIYPFSDDAIRCELEIFQIMDTLAERELYLMNRGLSQASLAIGYDAYLNDSLLSLVIWNESTYGKMLKLLETIK